MSTTQIDHPITIEPAGSRLRVTYDGVVVADTSRALVMHETVYPAIYYIPREDVVMDMLEPTDHSTRCPYKGEASYFTIRRDGNDAENAVWSYEEPLEAVAEIKGLVAFYPRHVEIDLEGEGA